MPELLITCPKTGKPVATGFNMDEDALASNSFINNSVECPECGMIHEWNKEDAYFAKDVGGRESRQGRPS